MFTLPITTASAEKSFSKIKIIKNYLRITMVQKRLSHLAIILIENEICKHLDYGDLIATFSKAKARKINFI